MSGSIDNNELLNSCDTDEGSKSFYIQRELDDLRERIKHIRFGTDLDAPIRNWELIRLFEVQNVLDLEIQKSYEEGLREIIDKLKLDELNASALFQGSVKCSVQRKFGRMDKERAVSFKRDMYLPRKDSFMALNVLETIENQPNEHMQKGDMRKEIIDQLFEIEKKKNKSKYDLENRERIMSILRGISEKIESGVSDSD